MFYLLCSHQSGYRKHIRKSRDNVETGFEVTRPMRSWLLLFSCNFMWALQFTCIKLVQDQVGSLFTVWGPMTLATVMLYPLVRLESKSVRNNERRSSDILIFLLLAVVGVFPGQVFITW